jgi:class 3 adenylate cyclase
MTLKERAEQMEAELLRDGATQILDHLEAVVREAAEVVNVADGDPDLVILAHFGLTESK